MNTTTAIAATNNTTSATPSLVKPPMYDELPVQFYDEFFNENYPTELPKKCYMSSKSAA